MPANMPAGEFLSDIDRGQHHSRFERMPEPLFKAALAPQPNAATGTSTRVVDDHGGVRMRECSVIYPSLDSAVIASEENRDVSRGEEFPGVQAQEDPARDGSG